MSTSGRSPNVTTVGIPPRPKPRVQAPRPTRNWETSSGACGDLTLAGPKQCCSALTCTIPTKLRSHQQSAERDPQGPKARWGHWTKGFPNTFPLHSPLLSSIQPHVGKGAPCSYLRGQAPANQAVCTAVWGRVFLGRQSYLWFYPLLFITRRNNKIETFVWKMQWKSGRERDGEGMGQDNSPVQGGKGSRLLPNPPTQGILTLDSRS